METKVADNPDASRFEIYAGDELAGFAEYHLHRDELAFIHTEVDPTFGGQGLAGKLARYALDDARGRNRTVLPY